MNSPQPAPPTSTGRPLRILLLEDNPLDAELEVAVLEAAGYACTWDRVQTREEFLARLEQPDYDLVFADYNLPAFDGMTALALFRAYGLDLPFILISGTVGEEQAIDSMRAGATDYVLKTRLARLVPVVQRALRERAERHQRRSAEEAGRESEWRFRTLANQAPVGIVLIDPHGNCAFVNERWCAMAGLSRDEAMGHSWMRPIHADDRQRVAAEWAAIAATEEHLWEFRFGNPDGAVTWLHGRTLAIHDDGGTITGYLGTLTDVTVHKQVEEELRRVNQLKADFVATMSHELRTPLNVIMGYTDLMIDGAFGALVEQQTEPLKKVQRSAQHLLDLINATLDLGRLEKGAARLNLREIRLADLLDEFEREGTYTETKPSVRLVRDLAPDFPPFSADRAKLKIILRSLLANAFKFTEAGTVTVSARSSDEGTEIFIVDTGIGIGSDVLPIIFDPYRQGESAMTRLYGGVGLGLYIVRRLLDAMGGTVSVESALRRGSTFRVWIPSNAKSGRAKQARQASRAIRA